MRILNDYECSDCLKRTEEYEEPEILTLICKCGGVKHKQIGAGAYFKINGSRMDLMTEQWAKIREANGKRARKHES